MSPFGNEADHSQPEQSEPVRVVVELDTVESSAFADLRRQFPAAIEVADVKRFGGEMGFTAAMVSLSAAIIPALTKVLIEHIRSKRHVRVKLRGIEITGVNESTVKDILTKLLAHEAQGK